MYIKYSKYALHNTTLVETIEKLINYDISTGILSLS